MKVSGITGTMLRVSTSAAPPSFPPPTALSRIDVIARKAPASAVRRGGPAYAPQNEEQRGLSRYPTVTVGFYRVADRLFVGKRPDEQRFRELAQLGICHIVSLEDGLSIGRRKRKGEHARAAQYHMEMVDMPMSPVFPLRFRNVAHVIDYITNKDNQPVYVHCLFGQERALFLAGLIRVYYDDWTPERAYKEMRTHGYRPWLVPVLTTQYWRWSRSQNRRDQMHPTPQQPSRGDLPPGSTANENTHPNPPVVSAPPNATADGGESGAPVASDVAANASAPSGPFEAPSRRASVVDRIA